MPVDFRILNLEILNFKKNQRIPKFEVFKGLRYVIHNNGEKRVNKKETQIIQV